MKNFLITSLSLLVLVIPAVVSAAQESPWLAVTDTPETEVAVLMDTNTATETSTALTHTSGRQIQNIRPWNPILMAALIIALGIAFKILSRSPKQQKRYPR